MSIFFSRRLPLLPLSESPSLRSAGLSPPRSDKQARPGARAIAAPGLQGTEMTGSQSQTGSPFPVYWHRIANITQSFESPAFPAAGSASASVRPDTAGRSVSRATQATTAPGAQIVSTTCKPLALRARRAATGPSRSPNASAIQVCGRQGRHRDLNHGTTVFSWI